MPEYAETLTILTGRDIPNPYQYVADRKTPVRQAVQKLVAEWWEPEREKISTNLEDWSAGQLQVLASRILKREARGLSGSSTDPESWMDRPTSYAVYHLLYYRMMTASSSDRSDWRLEELHPRMVPTWLAAAGYRPEPKQPPQRDTSRPAYAAVPLLAALRQNGELDELDEIAEDERQTAGTRLTCVMALHRAGEKLRTPVLLSVACGDKNLERRLVAILALPYCEDRKVGESLVKLLDDENAEVRTAAICALAGPKPPQAVPKLKRAIDELDPPQAMLFTFAVLGKYKSREACEALAGFLAAGLEDKRKTEHLRNALAALEAATGQRWSAGDSRTEASYRAKVQAAVTWWKTEGRRTME